MAHWLLKSEPHKYSWDMMVSDGRTHWDGVRNHQAAINLKDADGIGGSDYNQRLSERRAHAVRDWLIHQEHINPGQLEAEGAGSKRPVVPLTGDRDAQRPNRRVELRVVD